jgi:biopolymer transport protein TolQ
LLFSAISWGTIIYKKRQFRRAAFQTTQFLDTFRKSSRFSEVASVCANLQASPLVGLFQAGYAELNAQLRNPAAGGTPRPTLKSMESVDRALLRATTTELARLEHRISFLATTASITPYIGLFGTVWGIMTSFLGIAASGQTSLGVVAPGIAEALIATAAGLFAAIPAVFFYNDLTGRVKSFVGTMEDFSMEFLNIAERNFT